MITKENLILKGFKELGKEEDDIFYKIIFKSSLKGLAPSSLSGSFNEKGFDLYGYGIVNTLTELNNIFSSILTLSKANTLDELIYVFR